MQTNITNNIKTFIYRIVNPSEEETDIKYKIFDTSIIVLILLCLIAIILESIKSFQTKWGIFFYYFEVFSVFVFTVEYLLRLWTSDIFYQLPSNKIRAGFKYIVSPMAIVDLLAIGPFYLPMLTPIDLRFIRILRILRVLRIIKMSRYVTSISFLASSVKERANDLIMTFVMIMGLILISSSLMYNFENQAQPEKFTSIIASFWWAIATLTTVGYGDIYPITGWGKFFSSIISLLGIGFVALPTGIITAGFMEKMLDINKTYKEIELENHVIIVGWNSLSKDILQELVISNMEVVIITNEKDHFDIVNTTFEKHKKQISMLLWDLENHDYAEKVNLAKSAMVFINHGDDSAKLISILNIKKKYLTTNITVMLDNDALVETFHSAGATHVLSQDDLIAKLIASQVYEPDVAIFIEDLMATTQKDEDYDIQQFLVIDQNPFRNKTYGQAFLELKQQHNALLIGMVKIEEDKRILHKLPEDQLMIQQGDFLLVIVNAKNAEDLSDIFGVQEGIII